MNGTANGSLSESQTQSYWDNGFLFPIRVMDTDQAVHLRAELETTEGTDYSDQLPRALKEYLRIHTDVVLPMAAQMALQPVVLDAVESIIGPDIMIWGAEFFIKEACTPQRVSMHQDLTYWGFGETSHQVTAWIALSPSTVESGCVDLVAGSHKNPILPHNDKHETDNLLSRGQEVAVEVAEEDRTHVVLQPGEMSLHHGLAIHGSHPNQSNDRRIGFAIRYINPNARKQTDVREFAMLARGSDTSNAFNHYAPPVAPFSRHSLALYEDIRRAQEKVLSIGMDESKMLYSSSR